MIFWGIARIVYIDDNQIDVCSMRIADLLATTVMQIEAISKKLYFSNGGTKQNGPELFFDTDCIQHLVDLWKIDKKVVHVSSPSLYLGDENNIRMTPLYKDNKRGISSADWNKGYQAVKHDRVNNLQKGSIKTC